MTIYKRDKQDLIIATIPFDLQAGLKGQIKIVFTTQRVQYLLEITLSLTVFECLTLFVLSVDHE